MIKQSHEAVQVPGALSFKYLYFFNITYNTHICFIWDLGVK